MRITGVTQYHAENALDGSYNPTWIPGYPQATNEAEVIEVETDEGIVGYAASPSFAGGIEYEDQLSLLLVGQDPHDLRTVRRRLETFDLIGPRPWHVEMALWDIIGKDAGKPVYELLGGSGREIRAYASTGEHKEIEERLAYIEERVDEGFEAVKLRLGRDSIEEDLRVAHRVRDEFPDLTLMADANMGWSAEVVDERRNWTFSEALRVSRELAALDFEWLEEPLDRHDYAGYARLREKTDIAIAGGEFTDGVHELREMLRNDALDIVQPDCSIACGLGQAKSIADEAERAGARYTPHSWTNGLGLVANLHIAAATEARWFEYPYEPPFVPESRDFLLSAPVKAEEGTVTPPDAPGLGVELNLD
jgi:L-alanine-DL-glutamate epimerase-like enolase superfamily enzyme